MSISVLLLIILLSDFINAQTDLTTCNSGFSILTQPPQLLPCDPYPKDSLTSSLTLECSVIVPIDLLFIATITWSITEPDDGSQSRRLARRGEDRITITDGPVYSVEGELADTVLLRSLLSVSGLELNSTKNTGSYFCHVEVVSEGETVFSNVSAVLSLLPSSGYTNLNKCPVDGGVFVTLQPQCLTFSGNISLPTTNPPPVVTDCHDSSDPTVTCSDGSVSTTIATPTDTFSPFPMKAVIIISSVGGGLALLVCVLLMVLLTTCCCLRKPDHSKASLRTFKDRSIPLSTSMNNINIIENATSQSNLITAPIDIAFSTGPAPFSASPAPSHPPPVRTTLPTRHKHTVAPMISNDGSVTSSTALIKKGRAATVVGKLKNVCVPTEEVDEEIYTCTTAGACKFETGPVYKSLIVRNREETPIYASTSLHGSMESLNNVEDNTDQPVYSEPTVPLSVSMQSLVSESDSDQPEYTEPSFFPHSYSSYSLHSPTEKNNNVLAARTRHSLPLNRRLAVSPLATGGTEEQPIYSEVDDWLDSDNLQQDAGTPSEATPTLQDTTPTRQGKKKPVVPPRPHKRQNRSHTLNTPDQSECSIQRESVDGEYVCPNALVNIRTFRSQSSSEGEVIQVDNQDIAMSPNTAALRDSKGYLTLYMSPEN